MNTSLPLNYRILTATIGVAMPKVAQYMRAHFPVKRYAHNIPKHAIKTGQDPNNLDIKTPPIKLTSNPR